MKRFYLFIYLGIFTCFFSFAQTTLPSEKYLIEQYNLNMSTKNSYSTIEALPDKTKENVYAFVSQSGDLTYNNQTYSASGTAGLLIQFKISTGEIVWSSTLGNLSVPLYRIESVLQDIDGNICMVARGDFQNGSELVLGNQTFAFRTDLKPTIVVATLNTSTHLWGKVRFIYAPDQQGLIVNPLFDKNGNFYICGTVNSSVLSIDNRQVESVGSIPGTNIFIYKEDATGKFIYNKQTSLVTSSSINNILFEVDNSENLFITGYISYITGAMSLDGVVVKNDTLSNKYDYSYSDIFLYKINSTGVVQFGKTYLYSGNESPLFLKAMPNGTLYLCGEYNGIMGNFPTTSGELFYNRFYSKISGENGTFLWSFPLYSDVYYSDRNSYHTMMDENNNLTTSANFCPLSVTFMGHTYQKTNSKTGTSNTLVARISSDGVLQWGNVLGPVTTFETNYIDNPKVDFAGIGSHLVLQTAPLLYGTNKDFAWGSGAIPSVSMSGGMWGNMAVINNSGDVVYGYYQEFTKTFEIDSLHYFALRNNVLSWDVVLFNTNSVNAVRNVSFKQENELKIYPNPVLDNLIIENLNITGDFIEIYNIDSRLVLKQVNVNNRIYVGKLQTGIYMLKIGNHYTRFIKK